MERLDGAVGLWPDRRDRHVADINSSATVSYCNFDCARGGRLARGRFPPEIVYGTRKVKARWAPSAPERSL